jgi:hypothetical protein
MKTAAPIIFVFLFIIVGHTTEVWSWPPSYTEIIPQNPTPSDILIITLGGNWNDSCIPNASAISVTDNDVFFDVIWDYPPLTFCMAICCPAWKRTESIGPLSRGRYTVYSILQDHPIIPAVYTQMTEFIVSGNPDVDGDGDVDFVDLAIFSQAWKAQPGDDNWNSSCNISESWCNISEPNDDIIDEKDLAVIANNWLEGIPGITFQIDECTVGAVSMSAPSPDSDELRFSVTVHGRYILFEDIMVANCCPDKLYLDMTVQDNLITIYENEHTTTPCLCLCDYPVTSVLGPFEPGTYVLEVYEDTNGFIGGTIVIIE